VEAHAQITYQRHIVLLTVATVAAGMTAALSMIGQSMEWEQMLLVVVAVAARQRQSRATRPQHQRRHQRRHQHLRPDVLISRMIGRVRLEAHALITCQSRIVLLTVATVAVGMTAAPSMIGPSMVWQPLLRVAVVVAAPQ